MANGHGGKRTPRQPAPASPPGALSRRTDGGPQQVNAQMTGMAYGENSDFQDIQRSAPMSAARATPPTRSTRSRPQDIRKATPLMSKTQRPDEPVTDGADFGPGRSAAPTQQPADADLALLKSYLPDLEIAASLTGAPKTFKSLVSYLRNA